MSIIFNCLGRWSLHETCHKKLLFIVKWNFKMTKALHNIISMITQYKAHSFELILWNSMPVQSLVRRCMTSSWDQCVGNYRFFYSNSRQLNEQWLWFSCWLHITSILSPCFQIGHISLVCPGSNSIVESLNYYYYYHCCYFH